MGERAEERLIALRPFGESPPAITALILARSSGFGPYDSDSPGWELEIATQSFPRTRKSSGTRMVKPWTSGRPFHAWRGHVAAVTPGGSPCSSPRSHPRDPVCLHATEARRPPRTRQDGFVGGYTRSKSGRGRSGDAAAPVDHPETARALLRLSQTAATDSAVTSM